MSLSRRKLLTTGAAARRMYETGGHDDNYQVAQYRHPFASGFKDVIHQWHAEAWDPQHLIKLCKAAGAKDFMCLANHHDNLDNYAATYTVTAATHAATERDWQYRRI